MAAVTLTGTAGTVVQSTDENARLIWPHLGA